MKILTKKHPIRFLKIIYLGQKTKYNIAKFLRPWASRMRRPGMHKERPFPRSERLRQRSGRYGSKMERPGRRRPEYKEGWRNMDKKKSALEGVARGLGKGEKDCAETPTCGRAAWGPCHCTDKQGKQITWRKTPGKRKFILAYFNSVRYCS